MKNINYNSLDVQVNSAFAHHLTVPSGYQNHLQCIHCKIDEYGAFIKKHFVSRHTIRSSSHTGQQGIVGAPIQALD